MLNERLEGIQRIAFIASAKSLEKERYLGLSGFGYFRKCRDIGQDIANTIGDTLCLSLLVEAFPFLTSLQPEIRRDERDKTSESSLPSSVFCSNR